MVSQEEISDTKVGYLSSEIQPSLEPGRLPTKGECASFRLSKESEVRQNLKVYPAPSIFTESYYNKNVIYALHSNIIIDVFKQVPIKFPFTR